MNDATKFEGKEELGHPVNQVFAIIEDRNQSATVVKALHEAGIDSEDIGLLAGPTDAEKLDASIGKEGLVAKLASTGADFGDKDTVYLKKYRQALQENQAVVAVVAKKGKTREELAEILKVHGCAFINSFGRFIIERLEA